MICAMKAGSRRKADRKRRTGILLVTPEPDEGGPVSIMSFSIRGQMRRRLFKADSSPLGATRSYSDLRPTWGGPSRSLRFWLCLNSSVVYRFPKTKNYQTNPFQKIRFACKQRRKFTKCVKPWPKTNPFPASAPLRLGGNFLSSPNPEKISRHPACTDAELIFRRWLFPMIQRSHLDFLR